jgi:GT2 family glycosyltransferase/glycosyltransferase involved in cell wall biosynthesis
VLNDGNGTGRRARTSAARNKAPASRKRKPRRAGSPPPVMPGKSEIALRAEIDKLTEDLRLLQLELAIAERRNQIARNALLPRRANRLVRWLQKMVSQPRWLSEQLDELRQSRLFDENWYVTQNRQVQQSGIDPLSHYLLFGGFEGRQPNPHFDSKWYFETYPDVAREGINPLVHYIRHGTAERRWAGPHFDTGYYLDNHPDVRAAGIHPLLHYLRHGSKEGRATVRSRPPAKPPLAPRDTEWTRLRRRTPRKKPVVDIVVPVYRGYDDTLACLFSVLSAPVATPFELIVIDDASPDHKLSARLQKLAAQGHFTLLVNDANLGFVATVNRGMALHPDRDVLLLNADTIVYNDWLDRLMAQAVRDGIGTVTPFANNATICSYPLTLHDNIEELEIGLGEIDRLAARINRDVAIDIPTAVGCCMFIRRACLDEIGLFDVEAFGKGYGEENDFCRRAVKLGWRNVLAADVMIRHTGSVSFSATASEARSRALAVLVGKHPDYNAVVQAHIRDNPALAARRRLDAARLHVHTGGRAVLHVSHNWGGGIERHVNGLIDMFAARGLGGLVMTAPERDKPRVSIQGRGQLSLPNLQGLDLSHELREIAELLRLAGVERIHVHSLAGWSLEATRALPRLARLLGVPYAFTVHDYMAVCPQVTLVDAGGSYCGEKGIATCHACIAVKGTPFGRVNIANWRQQFRHLLDGAETVIAPSHDAVRRMSGYLDGRPVLYRPHPGETTAASCLARAWNKGEHLRILIIGGINEQKGARLLQAMAAEALEAGRDMSFHIVGHSDRDQAFAELANVAMTGRYREADLAGLVAAQDAHAFFMSSLWPETYSYVLSSALAMGFPIAAFDIGAQAERLREAAPDSLFLDLAMARDPGRVNRAILSWMAELPPHREARPLAEVGYTPHEYYNG